MTGTNFDLNYHWNQYSKFLCLINCKFPEFFKTPPILQFQIWKSTKKQKTNWKQHSGTPCISPNMSEDI